MELNFNWKYKDYELRACPKILARLNKEDQNETIDLIKWGAHNDGEKYCFSLAYWKRGSEGFDLSLVGSRVFEYIDEEDLEIVWEQYVYSVILVVDLVEVQK